MRGKKRGRSSEEGVDRPIDGIEDGESCREDESRVLVDQVHVFDLGQGVETAEEVIPRSLALGPPGDC